MRCQQCEYELWHCRGRICPECGTSFSLSDYIFEVKEVCFHCPECDDGVLGDDPQGKPSTLPSTCASCGTLNTLEDFVVKPAEGFDYEVDGLQLPIRTLEGNAFTRYFSTVWLIMLNPKTAIARIPPQEPISYAWKFYFMTLAILVFVGLLPSAVIYGLMPVLGGQFGFAELILIFVQAGSVVVFSILFVLSWSLITHGIIRMSGECKYPMRRTMQATLYGAGASVVCLVPCCGGLVGWVWWIVSSTNMIIRGHRITRGRAVFASIGGTICVLLLSCGAYIVLISALLYPATVRARNIATKAQQQNQQEALEEVEGTTPDQLETLIENPVIDPVLE